jgi:hypothetical protein
MLNFFLVCGIKQLYTTYQLTRGRLKKNILIGIFQLEWVGGSPNGIFSTIQKNTKKSKMFYMLWSIGRVGGWVETPIGKFQLVFLKPSLGCFK